MEAREPGKRILFVCTANVCRSYMAERMFKKQLKRRKLDAMAESAGLDAVDGAAADPLASEILKEKGFESGPHRSRTLSADLIGGADLVLVMEGAQRDDLLSRFPEAGGKVRLLKSFSPLGDSADPDIRDPHGRSSYAYRTCFADLYFSLEGLLRCI